MKESSFVVLQTWNSRPLPVVQDTTGIDQDIAMIADNAVGVKISNLDVVASALLIPVGTNDLMLCLDVVLQAIFVGESIEVFEDFLCWGIDS